ncbi:hypothetical protein GCM10009007_13070 [Formosimonas limnophila]|uniref:Transposase IS4-like domain-containing protein n=1 Tax=Formosimonas limnophila TaxID=1384487 RepID=A0A8J3FZE3_9BURK|nr:hypothetical protein GCM10009007_13070 [Formosimonas limnophila]
MTAGNVYDSQVFEQIIPQDTARVYADSAYASLMRDMWLKACGIDNRMIKRAYRNKPFTQAQKEQNRLNASVRSTVERVFGVLKLHLGMAKTKYLGLSSQSCASVYSGNGIQFKTYSEGQCALCGINPSFAQNCEGL